jgi:hypothetical protein
MRQAIAGVLLAVFGLLLPVVLDRIMSAAPEWAWRVASFLCVLVGVLVVLVSDPIFTRVRSPRLNPVSSTLIVALTAAFVVGAAWRIFVARPVFPLSVIATASDADYPVGSIVAGLPWSTKFSQLTIRIGNESRDRDYEHLDILIRPNEPIAGIAQKTSVPGVSFADGAGLSLEAVHLVGSDTVTDPTSLLATSYGYRVRCDRLPKGRHLEIIAVIAQPSGAKGYAVPFASGMSYWFRGTRDGVRSMDDYYAGRRMATDVFVEGDYVIGDRVTKVSRHVTPVSLTAALKGSMQEAQ